MKLLVVSYKTAWPASSSPSGYATDGGFPFQMKALSELFDATTLLIPCDEQARQPGEGPLTGHNLSVVPLTPPAGKGAWRKIIFPFWLLRNSVTMLREILRADAVHTPIPGDIGTIGMLLAFALRKPLFVRYCGNWMAQATIAEYFWKRFMETFAGGKIICLATGQHPAPPSRNPALKWIFATTMTEEELNHCATERDNNTRSSPRLVIACRQEKEKGTDVVIGSLTLLQHELPEIRLEVVGGGGALEAFRQTAAALSLNGQVTFHGQVAHDRVIELLRAADLFCFPTTSSEGFPKAALEAMACGLPVVTTNVSALPELVKHGGGVLIDEVTPRAVADAVRVCWNDAGRYRSMSRQATLTARKYSLEAWRDTIGALLRSAWGPLRSDA